MAGQIKKKILKTQTGGLVSKLASYQVISSMEILYRTQYGTHNSHQPHPFKSNIYCFVWCSFNKTWQKGTDWEDNLSSSTPQHLAQIVQSQRYNQRQCPASGGHWIQFLHTESKNIWTRIFLPSLRSLIQHRCHLKQQLVPTWVGIGNVSRFTDN